jgi:hypothetical protein
VPGVRCIQSHRLEPEEGVFGHLQMEPPELYSSVFSHREIEPYGVFSHLEVEPEISTVYRITRPRN